LHLSIQRLKAFSEGAVVRDKGVEPDLVRLSTGYYLVDTASRPGMSGAPVILRNWTHDYAEGGMRALNDKPATNLIGVYLAIDATRIERRPAVAVLLGLAGDDLAGQPPEKVCCWA
jgi:hypothetical protein